MSARAEWEPLTWEEAERNRRLPRGGSSCRRKAGGATQADAAPYGWIRHELERSRESVEEVRSELVQCRGYLQTWTAGESPAALANLPGLSERPGVNPRVEHFLVEWLAQLEEKLEVMCHGVESLAEQTRAVERAGSQPRSAARRMAHRQRHAAQQ